MSKSKISAPTTDAVPATTSPAPSGGQPNACVVSNTTAFPVRYGAGHNVAGMFTGGKAPKALHRWLVLCLDGATGKVLWERTAHEGAPRIPKHRNNTYASETPVTDGQRLVVYFGMTGLYCYDLAGQLLWNKDLGAYPMQFGWGTGSSPAMS